MPKFIRAYVVATGEKVRVPAHFEGHPVLWAGLSKTPRQKAEDKAKAPAKADTKTPPAADEGN